MIKAFIFDVDGVLVDSEDVSMGTIHQAFKNFGINMSRKEYKKYTGVRLVEIVKAVSKKQKVKVDIKKFIKHRYDLYEKIGKRTIKAEPGAKRLIKEIRKKKLKMAVATAGTERKLRFNLKCAGIDIRTRVTSKDVKRGKPAPDMYLLAAKKLKVKPEECIVVEDSVKGIEAAKKAGMFCIAVTNTFPRSKLHKADLIVDSLHDLEV